MVLKATCPYSSTSQKNVGVGEKGEASADCLKCETCGVKLPDDKSLFAHKMFWHAKSEPAAFC